MIEEVEINWLGIAWILVPTFATWLFFIRMAFPPLSVMEILLASFPVSVGLGSVVTYLAACYYGQLNYDTLVAVLTIFGALGLVSFIPAVRTLSSRRALWLGDMSKQIFLFCLLIITFVLAAVGYFLASLRLEDGELVAVMNSDSKLLLHTAVTNSFLMGSNAVTDTLAWDHPPHSPFLPSEPLYASFLPDFYVAACVHAGWNTASAQWLVYVGLAVSFVGLLFCLCRRMVHPVGREGLSFLALVVALGAGGLGFIHFFNSRMDLSTLLQFNFAEKVAVESSQNIEWKSLIGQILLDDPVVLFGYSIIVTVFLLLLASQEEKTPVSVNVRAKFLAGVLVGILPLIHYESFLSGVLFALALIIVEPSQLYRLDAFAGWLSFWIPLVALAVPEEIHAFLRSMNAPLPDLTKPRRGNVIPPFMKLRFAWENDRILRPLLRSSDSMRHVTAAVLFWSRTLSLFVPLYLLRVSQCLPFRQPTSNVTRMTLASFLVFVCLNCVQFGDRYSTIQLFHIWVFVAAGPVVCLLAKLVKRFSGFFKLIVVLLVLACLVVLVLSSGLSVAHKVVQPSSVVFTKTDLVLGRWLPMGTRPTDIILSYPHPRNVVNVLGGRNVMTAPHSWLNYQRHYNVTEPLASVKRIFEEGTTLEELQEMGIRFVMLDSDLHERLPTYNATFWDSAPFRTVFRAQSFYRIYEVAPIPRMEDYEDLHSGPIFGEASIEDDDEDRVYEHFEAHATPILGKPGEVYDYPNFQEGVPAPPLENVQFFDLTDSFTASPEEE